MRRPSLVLATAIVAASTLAAGCISSGPSGTGHPSGARTIVVGVSGAFAENQLVAEMYAQVLEHAGYTVEREFDLRSREVSQSALESGQIDLKPEYLSSLLLFLDSNAQASSDPTDVARQVGDRLRPKSITVLTPSPAQDTNQFVANAKTAQEFNLTTLSCSRPSPTS